MEENVRPLSDIPAINRFLSYCRIRTVPSKTVLIHAGDLLLKPARLAVTQIAFEIPYRRSKIVTAALGTDAGLIGAVAWAVRSFGGAPVGMR